jgi:hypothetical protein
MTIGEMRGRSGTFFIVLRPRLPSATSLEPRRPLRLATCHPRIDD